MGSLQLIRKRKPCQPSYAKGTSGQKNTLVTGGGKSTQERGEERGAKEHRLVEGPSQKSLSTVDHQRTGKSRELRGGKENQQGHSQCENTEKAEGKKRGRKRSWFSGLAMYHIPVLLGFGVKEKDKTSHQVKGRRDQRGHKKRKDTTSSATTRKKRGEQRPVSSGSLSGPT